MEVHEDHGRSTTRRGRKRGGERGLGGAVQAEQRILVEQSKSWSAFGTEPITQLPQSVQYGIVNTETNLGRPRVMSE